MTMTVRPGDLIRENRQLAPVEEVMSVNGNMITTYAGRMYHVTKIVLVEAAGSPA
jgi:hypothetical protein